MGILQVHNLVADVVGGLDEVDQRVAYIAQRLARLRNAKNAQFIGNFLIVGLLRAEEPELPFMRCCRRGVGVFHDAGQGGVGHDEAALAATLKLVGQQAEGIGVTLEVGDVVPEVATHLPLQVAAGTF